MADVTGSARTNFFPVIDLDGLKKSIEPFDSELTLEEHEQRAGYFFLIGSGQTGSIPSSIVNERDQEITFDFAEHVMPYVRESFVVVVTDVAAEELKYLSGYSEAYFRKGPIVEQTIVSLHDIYDKAAEVFKVERKTITECAYDYVEKEVLNA